MGYGTRFQNGGAYMKVIKMSQVRRTSADGPLFTGGPVTRQELVGADNSKFFNIANVHFSKGSRNKLHTHSSDQVLLVTEGTGIVATDSAEHTVTVGDIIHIQAGEKHWHGATKTSTFSHITVTQLNSKTEQLEP
ncbi:MAG: cupin domain-containing protein [Dehalococcoidia bacterium]|nr:cupin domain-containing protein [Dehalococcoidia bacterium]